MNHFVVRLWLADRPGALGEIASAIGAVGGDVRGIDILERGGGQAIDEIVVGLPDGRGTEPLVTALRTIDGVAIEDIRRLDRDQVDASTAALQIVDNLVRLPRAELLDRFRVELSSLLDGEWSAVIDLTSGEISSSEGDVPEPAWLTAFIAGSQHLDATMDASTPPDVIWAVMDSASLAIVSGRSDRPFHARERHQVQILGRVVDGLLVNSESAAAAHSV